MIWGFSSFGFCIPSGLSAIEIMTELIATGTNYDCWELIVSVFETTTCQHVVRSLVAGVVVVGICVSRILFVFFEGLCARNLNAIVSSQGFGRQTL